MSKLNSWQDVFVLIKKQQYFTQLAEKVNNAYKTSICYPPAPLIFNAFKLTPLENVKVVIIGQDPYHQPGQAMGLAFSVPEGVVLPPSLKNIYREIKADLQITMKNNGDLTYLAKQGVLLLNARLSVKANSPLSHNFKEYEYLLRDILLALNELDRPLVFILWGTFAKSLQKYLNNPKHLYLTGTHPSPLGANRGGFFGGKYFSKTNDYLASVNIGQINWQN